MLFDLLINFSILFTFAVLSYWPLNYSKNIQFPFPKSHPFVIGIVAGLVGFVLMESSYQSTDTVIIDARHVVVLFAGIFGGPIAPIISGVIIGLARMMMMDGFTTTGLLAGLNIISIGLIIGVVSYKYPITFKNAPLYFVYATTQIAMLLAYLMYHSTKDYLQLVYFVIYSFVAFFTVLYILIELNDHFKKIRDIELLSETDYLTGLYNNRKFYQVTHDFITHSRNPFCMISIDIDHFKKVNDVNGHPVGDEILRQLGERLKQLLVLEDCYITRNGGEQFIVLFPNSPPAIGLDLGERIRSSVARKPFILMENHEVSISVSIGVSSYPDNGSTIKELYAAADAAMYEAKSLGRNRVFHYNNRKA